MNSTEEGSAAQPHYELRFQFLHRTGRALAFPCDATGAVDLDTLSETARRNYAYAIAAIGRELAVPDVQLSGF